MTLTIASGDVVALVGQNGSGKTTLVRHLNGLLRPTEGRVLVDGQRRGNAAPSRSWRSRVGLVFQDPDRQIFAGSVRSEVEFGPRNLGRCAAVTSRPRSMPRSMAAGLRGEDEPTRTTSAHSRRKLLALASVLAMRTPVLVLDEPTTGQDARGVERVRSIVDACAADAGRTVIAISHDMRFVAETFERVVVMRERACPARRHAGGGLRGRRAAELLRRPTSSRRWRRASATGWGSDRRRPRPPVDALRARDGTAAPDPTAAR